MISVRKLVKEFGPRRAVDQVSFEVERGEVLGFLGPNGAGKTTTMRMITGFLYPDEGTVVVDGVDVIEDPVSVKSRIGYLPEGAPSYPEMTVADFLGFVAEIRGFDGQKRKDAIDGALATCHLDAVTSQLIGTLSKGFRQRVGFAQAILHDPPVLVLDEPTDGLDPNQKHEVRNLICNLAAKKVIILSTHILEEVEAVCTRAIVMSRGRLVADDTPANLLQRSTRHGLVDLHLENGDAGQLKTDLERLEGVEQVELFEADASGPRRLSIYPRKGVTLQPALGRFLKERGAIVHELHKENGRLDDVFRQITQSDV